MNRSSLIQFLINKHGYTTYLEIGTQRGFSFFPIRCKKKIAVDPLFLINPKQKRKWLLKNLCNFRNKYFEMTSDEFFSNNGKFLRSGWTPDIVLIDGLHTFQATLKDILNSLQVLKTSGTIVIHDCFPPHKAASVPGFNAEEVAQRSSDIPGWTGEWCGDTWKSIVYLRKKYHEELKVEVLNTDYGLGIVQIKTDAPLNLDIDMEIFEDVNSMRYEDLEKDPMAYIGLRNSEEFKSL